MEDIVLKTNADDLYELVKSRKKLAVEDAAKILKVPQHIVQSLVDFLVEEKILGIEYKFTTPYIYLGKEEVKQSDLQSRLLKKLLTKEQFFQRARKSNVSLEKAKHLWKKYIQKNHNLIKEVFYIKAHSRDLPEEKIESLWEKYWSIIQ
ncbi:hypothetical protein KY347_05925 [Candidatus Woesearchaeota archaeon]|nr:hypothetical protein [Candidatus Woesearchaeota archaeon]